MEQRALALINDARHDARLEPLTDDRTLDAAARAHSADMAERDDVSHTAPRPDRMSPGRRLAAAGVSDAEYGENVGRFGTSRDGATWTELLRELSDRLLASPAHRPQILGAAYTHAGTGVAFGLAPADADSAVTVPAVYLTQLFVSRRAVLHRLSARIEGSGMRITLRGRLTGPGRARLGWGRPGDDRHAVPLTHDAARFAASFVLPVSRGTVMLELDALEGAVTRPARRWRVDPLQPPDLAITSGLGD